MRLTLILLLWWIVATGVLGCGEKHTPLLQRYKCTNQDMIEVEKYTTFCTNTDYMSAHCFDSAVVNFCTPNKSN